MHSLCVFFARFRNQLTSKTDSLTQARRNLYMLMKRKQQQQTFRVRLAQKASSPSWPLH